LFVRAQVNGIRFDDTVVRGGNAPLGVLPRNVDAYLRAAARSSASRDGAPGGAARSSGMTERRYDDAEVAAIFERAAEAPEGPLVRYAPQREGMTLAELQAIGREVGIPAESIALAAQTVSQGSAPPARRFMGFPIGVARTVQLERRLTDAEWERIVVDLRETFEARGSVRSEGSLRQWTNGNLQVLLEPTATGDRVRLRTTKSDATGMLGGGLGMVGASVGMGALAAVQGAFGDTGMVMAISFLGILGAGMFGSSAIRVPRWARTRQQQMEEVAARIAHMASAPSLPDESIAATDDARRIR
jgi:hypothetical protein